jgi:propionyl-CoA carboxylase alpha chain
MSAVTKLFIANRGEIARRVRRTASRMGIGTIAAYTAPEADAPFVTDADEAIELDGSGPAAYLDIKGLIETAKRAGADAVHPGYGFLAENADFARAVTDAGLIWVGPPADAIARMGDKLESKRVAREANVPTLEPMDSGDISFPALVKAAAGGGGKGMRVVHSKDELDDAIASAQREAERAFGDGTIFIEPFLAKTRHIEIQIVGDGHGNLVHLFERECSIQRRHQKVVEEAPSVAVDADLRERIGDAAVSLARAIGYRNAGTVEFLLADDGRFYFMEMNTRLQVEHPVTEEVTGIDLVEQQLLDAMGERLSFDRPDAPDGHSIEVRLNSEDPSNDFLPSTGKLIGWAESEDPAVRVESGVTEDSVVGTTFDPLIAKFIASGPSRREVASRLALALERTVIQGVQTNRDLLVALLRNEAFVSGDTTTDFLDRVELPARRVLTRSERDQAFSEVVAAAELVSRESARVLQTFPSGWRNSIMPAQQRILEVDGEEHAVAYASDTVRAQHAGDITRVERDDRSGIDWWVHGVWGDVHIVEKSPFPSTVIEEASGSLHAPMPGSVVSVDVAVGDTVRKGQTLVVLEAMKMEHPIGCPEDGVVSEVKVAAGDQVERGALLVVVDAPA